MTLRVPQRVALEGLLGCERGRLSWRLWESRCHPVLTPRSWVVNTRPQQVLSWDTGAGKAMCFSGQGLGV